MNLSYDGIKFEVLKVHEAIWEQIYDASGERFLYNHIGLRATCWLNPAATAATDFPPRPGAFVFRPGDQASPAQTFVELINRLKQPRRTLVLSMNSLIPTNVGAAGQPVAETILTSPLPGMPTDARLGPTCKVHGIIPDHGLASLVLDMEFHTHVAPCASANASPIVANVWKTRDAYSEENFARSRITEGTAYFRMDVLATCAMAGSADVARDFVVPPIPTGFKRIAPLFELNETGDALRYVLVDVEQPMSFPMGNSLLAASIKVVENRSYTKKLSSDELRDFAEKAVAKRPIGKQIDDLPSIPGSPPVGRILKKILPDWLLDKSPEQIIDDLTPKLKK